MERQQSHPCDQCQSHGDRTTDNSTSTTTPPPTTDTPSFDVSKVDSEGLIKNLLGMWASEIKGGMRREANRTLALLVRVTSNPRKRLPMMAKYLSRHKVEVGSTVFETTMNGRSWKNPGISRHARQRGTVIKIKESTAKVEYEDKLLAYDIVDTTGHLHSAVLASDVKGTGQSKRTNPGGNRRTHTFRVESHVLMRKTKGKSGQ